MHWNDCMHMGQQALERVIGRVDQAEVSVHSTWNWTLMYRNQQVEQLAQYESKMLVITVYSGQSVGTASTTQLTSAHVRTACDQACKIAAVTASDAYAGLADPTMMVINPVDCDADHPWTITTAATIQTAARIESEAVSVPKIKACDAIEIDRYRGHLWLGNSHGVSAQFINTLNAASVVCVSNSGQHLVRDSAYTRANNPEQLTDFKALAQCAAHRTVARIDARSVVEQTVPILFSAEMTRQIFGQLAVAISGGVLYREASFLCGALGDHIFPKFISIYQRPHLLQTVGAQPFDDEGVRTMDRTIVSDGCLQSYILSAYSARRLGLNTTGNAGGIQTWCVEDTQNLTFQDLLNKMGSGLYVTEMMGSGNHIVTGDFSRGVFGFWVEQGEIQYPVHEVTISGQLSSIFKGCLGIAQDDVDQRGVIQTGSMLIESMTIAGAIAC